MSRSLPTSAGRVLPVDHGRVHGGDVHADVAGQLGVAALALQQHAGGGVVMGVAAALAVDAGDPFELEHFADAVVQVVELPLERRRLFAGDGWASSASAVAAPGPVASCVARSLAN